MEKWTLPKKLQGKYVVVNTDLPCIIHPELGHIDFRTLTAEQAEALVKAGSMYIEKIKKADS